MDLDRDTPSRLTFLTGSNSLPVWTPDGKNIVFQSSVSGNLGLYWVHSDGSGEPRRLTDGKIDGYPTSFSPDGKQLAYFAPGSNGGFGVFAAVIDGDAGTVSRHLISSEEPGLFTRWTLAGLHVR